jgi:hypothetical protein
MNEPEHLYEWNIWITARNKYTSEIESWASNGFESRQEAIDYLDHDWCLIGNWKLVDSVIIRNQIGWKEAR